MTGIFLSSGFGVYKTNDVRGNFSWWHGDSDSDAKIFRIGTLRITGGGTPVVEPGAIRRLGASLVGLGLMRHRNLTDS